MAAMHEEEIDNPLECSNCGATDGLLTCSRCRSARFCSAKCQRAHWPFHKASCERNEFADMAEAAEPKFAAWMRRHGKLATLRDDEVDRLERASAATTGRTRAEVMESMYNRLEPKPAASTYNAEEVRAMREAEERLLLEARQNSRQCRAWLQVEVPDGLGLDCDRYKWMQNQSYIEIFFRLPEHVQPHQMVVELTTSTVRVVLGDVVALSGALWADIKREESTWLIQDGLLQLHMLKRNRRGAYADGATNADTFWPAVLKKHASAERLPGEYPPAHYYRSAFELPGDTPSLHSIVRGSRHHRPMIDRSRER